MNSYLAAYLKVDIECPAIWGYETRVVEVKPDVDMLEVSFPEGDPEGVDLESDENGKLLKNADGYHFTLVELPDVSA